MKRLSPQSNLKYMLNLKILESDASRVSGSKKQHSYMGAYFQAKFHTLVVVTVGRRGYN